MLKLEKLQFNIGDKKILNDLSLNIPKGEIHVLMGPNGVGKSTLGHAIMASPLYTHVAGHIYLDDENLDALSTEERAHKGLFLAFQHPVSVPGLRLSEYLRNLYHMKHKTQVSVSEFRRIMRDKLEQLNIERSTLSRYLNDGFSGGEMKRFEMLQLLILEPKVAILDEIDSGLDVDAQKIVAACINHASEKFGTSFLIVTHYQRLLSFIQPSKIHIMTEGKISRSGDKSIISVLEKEGYNFLKNTAPTEHI